MGTKSEAIRPRAYKAVEAFTFRPGVYQVVRMRRWADDGGGVVWAVQHDGVIVGKFYCTREEARNWAMTHARQSRFHVRDEEHKGLCYTEWGVAAAVAVNQKVRAALRSGEALVRVR